MSRKGRPRDESKARFVTDEDAILRHLERHHGIGRNLANQRLHKLKTDAGLNPVDLVKLDWTGNAYILATGESLGSLTEGGKRW